GSSPCVLPRIAPSPSPALSLHDALPILSSSTLVNHSSDRKSAIPPPFGISSRRTAPAGAEMHYTTKEAGGRNAGCRMTYAQRHLDRKSTPLNSSHVKSSYAVFCLKQKRN